VVPEGVKIPAKLAPVADKAAGAARRLAQKGWWWVTGEVPADLKRTPKKPASADATADALRDVFDTCGVRADLTGVTVGPRITMYEVRKHSGQSVDKVLKLQKELEYALGSPAIRIISPIPGKSRIGIEVPRDEFDPIPLADITFAFAKRKRHPLLAAIGKDIEGRAIIANLADMPHLLIAGATGAGKSACLNAILVSIILNATPDEVRMILIDPKRVEMMPYRGLPHLRMPVVNSVRKATDAMHWAVDEMEMRYDRLEKAGVRNIDEYNAKYPDDKMSYELIVIDELSDLMMCDEDGMMEDLIVRITQKARAAGMHMILATQRPEVKVVTGLIKSNVPSRLAFAVASGTDSMTILDRHGAEKLLGKGDGLFLPAGAMFPVRIQGPLVEIKEVESAVQGAKDGLESTPVQVELVESTPADDPLVHEAVKIVRQSRKASATNLQDRLGIGFARATRILESMERMGIVGPAIQGKPREILEEKA